MEKGILIGKGTGPSYILPKMANRHGLITGATGTGKTVTLQVIVEAFCNIGVPSFVADIKGDFSGISQRGISNARIENRLKTLGINDHIFSDNPVRFWDIFGKDGHPTRTTVSEMGPMLLSRLLRLNDTQSNILSIAFRIADDEGLLLLDIKDLKSIIHFVGENSRNLASQYGNIARQSIGAIQRSILALEDQGFNHLFGEPALQLNHLFDRDLAGRGMINILTAAKLMSSPAVYSTFLLWILSELFEQLPEVGDIDIPRMMFFFDEAHLLFNNTPSILLERIEQVIRLIRSKGVGVFFITQNPSDIPDIILGQLGNRVQHALRAFTPKDQRNVRVAAKTFRQNPDINTIESISQLGVGEALVSFLDKKGIPAMVEKVLIMPPRSQIGPITEGQKNDIIQKSLIYGYYENVIDRESAYGILKKRAEQSIIEEPEKSKGRRPGRKKQSLTESVVRSTFRSAGNQVGRSIVRGIIGSLFSKR